MQVGKFTFWLLHVNGESGASPGSHAFVVYIQLGKY